MTRISFYKLYECNKCGQVHSLPQYSSISVYVPWELDLENDSLLLCAKCGDKKAFSKFKFVGDWRKQQGPLPSWLSGRKLTFLEKIFGENCFKPKIQTVPPYPCFDLNYRETSK